uniref:Uncharacterized protein n=1 Tax=Globodera pallida TaxID=36090 RepID=A0A183C4I0_GLOPA
MKTSQLHPTWNLSRQANQPRRIGSEQQCNRSQQDEVNHRQTGAWHAYAPQPNWTNGHTSNRNGPTRTSHPEAIRNKNNNRLDINNSGRMEHAFNKDMAPINGKAMVNVNNTLDDYPTDNCEPANNLTRPNNTANVDNDLASSNSTQKSGSIKRNINATATTNQHVDYHNFKAYNSKPVRHDQLHIANQQITFRPRVEKHLSSKCKSNVETTSTTRKEISIALSTGRHRTDDPISEQLRTARPFKPNAIHKLYATVSNKSSSELKHYPLIFHQWKLHNDTNSTRFTPTSEIAAQTSSNTGTHLREPRPMEPSPETTTDRLSPKNTPNSAVNN